MSSSSNHQKNIFIVLIASAYLVGCNIPVEINLYTRDVYEITDTPFTVPMEVHIPINSVESCEENKTKLLPVITSFAGGQSVKFKECLSVVGMQNDKMVIEIGVPIIKASNMSNLDGLVTVVVQKEDGGNITVSLALRPDHLQRLEKALDAILQHSNVDFSNLTVTVRIRNDMRQTISVMLRDVMLNGQPYATSTTIDIIPRQEILLIPSNVQVEYLIQKGVLLIAVFNPANEAVVPTDKT